jgi:hypothetical protein
VEERKACERKDGWAITPLAKIGIDGGGMLNRVIIGPSAPLLTAFSRNQPAFIPLKLGFAHVPLLAR